MLSVILAIIGLVVGGAVAWLLSMNRTKSRFEAKLQESEQRASTTDGKATALEASLTELRTEKEKLGQKADEDFRTLRMELSTEQKARVKAETQMTDAMARLEEEKKLLDEAREKLTEAFKAIAGDTLNASNQAFLKLAAGTFDKVLAEAKGDLGTRQEAISGLVKPLSESLKQFEDHVRQLELGRKAAYTGIEEQHKNLASSLQLLQKTTGNLETALRTPQVRGRWGEMTLRRVVELAGLSEHSDFDEQVSMQTEDGRIRPDLVVHLPADRDIVVDAKVSLDAYLKALSADSEEERDNYLADHARQIRAHMNNLGGKAYFRQFDKAPEFVVMFIPGESFFAVAAHHDHNLIEDGMEMSVVLATPTTLIALLRAVAYGWRQEQIAKSAQEVGDLGRQLYDRMRVLAEHISGIGNGLDKANAAYNRAVSSIEARVLTAARRFKDHGVASGEEIPIIEPVETTPRALSAPELGDGEQDT